MFRVLDQRRNSSITPRSTVVSFEPMEKRELMSTAPLFIVGTDQRDDIAIKYEKYSDGHDAYKVYQNGWHTYKDISPIFIQVVTYKGNDRVSVASTKPGEDLRISTGDGDDYVNLGNGGEPFKPGKYDFAHFGNTTLDMGAGLKDGLEIDQKNSTTKDIADFNTFTDASFTAAGRDKNKNPIVGITTKYSGVEDIRWDGGPEDTTWNIKSTKFKTKTLIAMGTGKNSVDVGDGDLDSNIMGNLDVYGGYHDGTTDGIQFNDYKDVLNDKYTLNDHSLVKSLQAGTIDFFGFENVFLQANNGNNSILVDDNRDYEHFVLFGNGGDDYFTMVNMTHKLNNIAGLVTAYGGPGDNSIFLPDENLAHDSTVTLSDTGMKQNGKLFDFFGMRHAYIQLSEDGKDLVTVTPSPITEFNVNAGYPNNATVDEMKLNLFGVSSPSIGNSSVDLKSYAFNNRKRVYAANFEKYPTVFNADTAISGKVFKDYNGDGQQGDPSLEPGVKGRTVFVDLDNDGLLDKNELSAVTDQYGNFTLYGLVPGTYKVRQVLPNGAKQTTPAPGKPIVVTLGNNQKVNGLVFGSQSF